jgi:hypothetical protein
LQAHETGLDRPVFGFTPLPSWMTGPVSHFIFLQSLKAVNRAGSHVFDSSTLIYIFMPEI